MNGDYISNLIICWLAFKKQNKKQNMMAIFYRYLDEMPIASPLSAALSAALDCNKMSCVQLQSEVSVTISCYANNSLFRGETL